MPRNRLLAVVAALVLLWIGLFIDGEFYRARPAPSFASDEEHFLYGSLGNEGRDGIPFWIWLVLPRIFPDHLPGPGGYAAIGVVGADGHEMPVGFSKATVGVERVGVNCAFCHTGSYRLRADAPRTIVPTAPAHQLAPQLYLKFLFACASDPRFTADTILGEIAKNYRLSFGDRLAYRFGYVPSTRRALLRLQDQLAWTARRPDWGFGRMDLFNAIKFGPLRQPPDDSIGTVDLPPLWGAGRPAGAAHFWDGSNASLDQAVLASAIGGGADRTSLQRVQRYIAGVKAPAFPAAIDRPMAAQGAGLFRAQCASCHASGGGSDANTDPRRAQSFTADTASRLNAYELSGGSTLSGFRATGRYAAVPLDGLWLRGPYLHNGSVPTLEDLLKPAAARPVTFWRGDDVLDPAAVGFVSSGPDAERIGTVFDTRLPGNGNGGHEYGTSLTLAEKRALLEYLKTL